MADEIILTLPQIWPFEADSSEEQVETYGYLTDVLVAENRQEQRVRLRRHPTQTYEFSFLCEDPIDGAFAESLLYLNRASSWVVPLWNYACPLLAPVSGGATVLTCNTVNAPFQDVAGLGIALAVWRAARACEPVGIQSVSSGSITLKNPGMVASYGTPGTWVIPARMGYLVDPIELRWHTGRIVGGRVKFIFDAVDDFLVSVTTGGYNVFGEIVEPIGG